MNVGHVFFGGKKRRIATLVLAALLVSGATFAAIRIISNILTLGPTQHVVESVELTTIENLPSTLRTGEEGRTEFGIRNLGSSLTGVTLKARVKASGTSLPNASVVTLGFQDPETDTRQSVSLTVAGGNLEGTLKSNWALAENYQNTARLWLTLTRDAPRASYSLEVWAEIGDAGGTPPPPPATRSFTLNAVTSGFVGVSGTNADGTSIAGVTNPVLRVSPNETVRITIVRQDSIHNVAVYTVPCPGGFCATGLVGRSADVTGASSQTTLTVTAPASGTLFYYCDYHSGMMSGTIQVVP